MSTVENPTISREKSKEIARIAGDLGFMGSELLGSVVVLPSLIEDPRFYILRPYPGGLPVPAQIVDDPSIDAALVLVLDPETMTLRDARIISGDDSTLSEDLIEAANIQLAAVLQSIAD